MCKYCNGSESLLYTENNDEVVEVWVERDELNIEDCYGTTTEIKINYCPQCGGKLNKK